MRAGSRACNPRPMNAATRANGGRLILVSGLPGSGRRRWPVDSSATAQGSVSAPTSGWPIWGSICTTEAPGNASRSCSGSLPNASSNSVGRDHRVGHLGPLGARRPTRAGPRTRGGGGASLLGRAPGDTVEPCPGTRHGAQARPPSAHTCRHGGMHGTRPAAGYRGARAVRSPIRDGLNNASSARLGAARFCPERTTERQAGGARAPASREWRSARIRIAFHAKQLFRRRS